MRVMSQPRQRQNREILIADSNHDLNQSRRELSNSINGSQERIRQIKKLQDSIRISAKRELSLNGKRVLSNNSSMVASYRDDIESMNEQAQI